MQCEDSLESLVWDLTCTLTALRCVPGSASLCCVIPSPGSRQVRNPSVVCVSISYTSLHTRFKWCSVLVIQSCGSYKFLPLQAVGHSSEICAYSAFAHKATNRCTTYRYIMGKIFSLYCLLLSQIICILGDPYIINLNPYCSSAHRPTDDMMLPQRLTIMTWMQWLCSRPQGHVL